MPDVPSAMTLKIAAISITAEAVVASLSSCRFFELSITNLDLGEKRSGEASSMQNDNSRGDNSRK